MSSARALGADAGGEALVRFEPLPLRVRIRRFLSAARMFVTIYGGYKLLQIWG